MGCAATTNQVLQVYINEEEGAQSAHMLTGLCGEIPVFRFYFGPSPSLIQVLISSSTILGPSFFFFFSHGKFVIETNFFYF